MFKQHKCSACSSHHLNRIGVRGILKCADCGSLVDIRNHNRRTKLLRWLPLPLKSSRSAIKALMTDHRPSQRALAQDNVVD